MQESILYLNAPPLPRRQNVFLPQELELDLPRNLQLSHSSLPSPNPPLPHPPRRQHGHPTERRHRRCHRPPTLPYPLDQRPETRQDRRLETRERHRREKARSDSAGDRAPRKPAQVPQAELCALDARLLQRQDDPAMRRGAGQVWEVYGAGLDHQRGVYRSGQFPDGDYVGGGFRV
jgi:hypothetical protein